MDIGDALVQIADKLGTTGEHLLKVFTEAQVGIGYINIISMIVYLLLLISICYIAYRYIKSKDLEYNEVFAVFLYVFLACMFMLFFILILKDEVTRIIYPEYTAIKDLISTLSDVVGK